MKKTQGMNALLIELVIVLFFFVLSFTVLAQVYAYAYRTEKTAALQNEALFEARNITARLRSADNPEEMLLSWAGEKTEEGYYLEREGYRLLVTCDAEKREAGIFYRMDISALQDDKHLWQTDDQSMCLNASVFVEEVKGRE